MAQDEKTVTMVFSKNVSLQTEPGVVKEFTMGTQEVPESLADHWFLKAMGATKYVPGKSPDGKSGPEEAKPPRQATEHEVQFLNARGYRGINSVQDAQEFLGQLEPAQVEEFWKEADAWEPAKEETGPANQQSSEPPARNEPEHNVPAKHTTTAPASKKK